MKKTIYLLLFIAASSVASAQTDTDSSSQNEEKKYDNRLRGQAQDKIDAGAKKVMQGLFRPKADMKYEDEYDFDVTLTYHIESFKKNGKKKDESDMEIWVNRSSNSIAILPVEQGKKEESMIVYDAANKVILTLLRDEDQGKTGMIMKFDPKNHTSDDKEKMTFSKAAEKKEILGYICTKYIGTDENGETEFWVTDKIDLNMQDVFGVMVQDKSRKGFEIGSDYPKGMVMESSTTDKKGATTIMTITELELKANESINASDYQLMSLGNMMRD